LLAGERHGVRIRAEQTGSIDFDLGNSPREFVPERVAGRRIVSTTTNGTRALKACQGAGHVLVGALLNVEAVTLELLRLNPERVLLVCSGTAEDAAFEDTVAAGAVVDRLCRVLPPETFGDAANCARQAFLASESNVLLALQTWARNGRRLHAIPDLAGDLPVCAAIDSVPLLAAMNAEGIIRRKI
jgi:2-phosphosulfolactate phosphatase